MWSKCWIRFVLEDGFCMILFKTVYVPIITQNLVNEHKLNNYRYDLTLSNAKITICLTSDVGFSCSKENLCIMLWWSSLKSILLHNKLRL